jgi:hypothetical protein
VAFVHSRVKMPDWPGTVSVHKFLHSSK